MPSGSFTTAGRARSNISTAAARPPRVRSVAWFETRGLTEIPFRGIVPATLTVPGAVASWIEAHRVHGRLPLARVLESAIGYAHDGFPVTERLASFTDMTRDELARHRESAALLLDGRGSTPGAKLTNENLARTLVAIADAGWSGFYEGPVAAEMARFAREFGRFLRPVRFPPTARDVGGASGRALPRCRALQHAATHAGLHGARNAQPRGAA